MVTDEDEYQYKKICFLTAHLMLGSGVLVVKKSKAVYEGSIQPLLEQGFVWNPDTTTPFLSQNVSQRITTKRISRKVSVETMANLLAVTKKKYQQKEDGILPWLTSEVEKACQFLEMNFQTVLPVSMALGSFNAPWTINRHRFCQAITKRPVEFVEDNLTQVPNIQNLLADLRGRRDKLIDMQQRLPGYNFLKINHASLDSMRSFQNYAVNNMALEVQVLRKRIRYIEKHLFSELITWGHVMGELRISKREAVEVLTKIGFSFKGTWLCTKQDFEDYLQKKLTTL